MKRFGMMVASAIVLTAGAGCSTATNDEAVGTAEGATTGRNQTAEFNFVNCGADGYINFVGLEITNDTQPAAGGGTGSTEPKYRAIALTGWFKGGLVSDAKEGKRVIDVGSKAAPFYFGVEKDNDAEGDDSLFAVKPTSSDPVLVNAAFDSARDNEAATVTFKGALLPRANRADGYITFSFSRINSKSSFKVTLPPSCYPAAPKPRYGNLGLLRTLSGEPTPGAASTQ